MEMVDGKPEFIASVKGTPEFQSPFPESPRYFQSHGLVGVVAESGTEALLIGQWITARNHHGWSLIEIQLPRAVPGRGRFR
jgi:hypothetical protein